MLPGLPGVAKAVHNMAVYENFSSDKYYSQVKPVVSVADVQLVSYSAARALLFNYTFASKKTAIPYVPVAISAA